VSGRGQRSGMRGVSNAQPSDIFPGKVSVKGAAFTRFPPEARSSCRPHRNSKEFWSHMKRLLTIALTLGSGIALSAAAQTPASPAAPSALAAPAAAAPDIAPAAPAGPAKIAVIAFQVAVAQTNEGQRQFADLEKKFDPKRQQLKTLSDEIDTMTKDLQAKGATLTDGERSTRAAAIDTKKKQLDRDADDARTDFQQQMQDMYQGLASKVYDVMQSYAEKQGYTLVLDVSEQQSPVLYASTATNITKQVIEAYNVKSGVPAPPPQTGADAPRPGTGISVPAPASTQH
jgi:outer membrane protein